jgi:mono/diheme cytochrome c family protein
MTKILPRKLLARFTHDSMKNDDAVSIERRARKSEASVRKVSMPSLVLGSVPAFPLRRWLHPVSLRAAPRHGLIASLWRARLSIALAFEKFGLGLLVVATALTGCITAPKPSGKGTMSPLEEKGWEVFQREPCFSTCHAQTVLLPVTEDWAGFVPDLRKTPRRTADWYMAYFVKPRAVLPNSFMPSLTYLPDDEIRALIAFLQRLNRGVEVVKPVPVPSEEIPVVGRSLAAYKAGQAIFNTYCAGCHGIAGNGGGSVGQILSPEPRDFTDAAWVTKQTENYLFSVITNGKPNTAMPGFKTILTPLERASVLRYVTYFADPVLRERVEVGLVGQISQDVK